MKEEPADLSRPIIVAVTGASGAIYTKRLLGVLHKLGQPVHAIASRAGRYVYRLETGRSLHEDLPEGFRLFQQDDFTAPMASGSYVHRGMVIVPCTMGTLASVAHGISSNLIHRAADVTLKERRPLVVVPRETPLNRTHLSNMLRLHDAGAVILPAMPGFYQETRTLEELADFIVARILQQLDIHHSMGRPWEGPPRKESQLYLDQ